MSCMWKAKSWTLWRPAPSLIAVSSPRFLHLGLYVDAARRGRASLAAIAGFAGTVTIGMALLLVGSVAVA